MKLRLSLFGRYWLALATLATLPLLIAGIVEGWFVYHSNFQAATERQTLQVRQAAYRIERSVLPPIDRVRMIANIPGNYPTVTAAEQEAEMRRLVRQFPLIAQIQRVTSTGDVVNSYARDGALRPLSTAEKDALSDYRPSDAASSPPLVFRRSGRASWSVAFLERGTGDRIVTDLSTDVVNDVVGSTTGPASDLVFVADQMGSILAHPTLAMVFGGANLRDLYGWSSVKSLPDILAGKGPVENSLGEISVRASSDPQLPGSWIAAYRRIPELSWTVFSLTPAANLHAELRATALRTAIILLTANAVALLLALELARRMSRPLRSLAAASERVANGDLTAHATVLADDDVGRLTRQFNAMVDQLNQSYAQLEQKVAEKTAALELANRHKSEFLTQMSHELRTPLNAIIGFSDALKAQYFGPLNDKQRDYAQFIHTSGQHLLALINDLLDLAKIEAGRMELALGRVNVRDLAQSATGLVRVRAGEQVITLRTRIDDGLTEWVADERKLKQVLVNLLSNAVKFTPAGGTVILEVTRTSGGLRFSVSDTGIGIPADQVSRLFTDFGQLQHGDKKIREGTGLGLALSQRMVQLHGGEIRVESEVGRGSNFYFTIPERKWPVSESSSSMTTH